MNLFRWTNIGIGWLCFLIALITYTATMEPTASFWDCGEFIASAYKLQVGHPPGAPLFAMVGRIFSLAAGSDVTKVAWMVNFISAVSSALTIAFLFWTITALVQKLFIQQNAGKAFEWDLGRIFAAAGCGLVGALAYTFSDTFWFSAVEGEVYASSSLFTAVVFWAMLKWDQVADQPRGDRWIVLIAYLMGLSVGVHLLNLLTIPAIGLIYYFRKYSLNDKGVVFVTACMMLMALLSFLIAKNSGIVKALVVILCGGTGYAMYSFRNETKEAGRVALTLVVSFAILIFIQYGIIPRTIWLAGVFEKAVVNQAGGKFGMGFGFYLAFLVAALGGGIVYAIRKQKRLLHLGLWCIVVILLGYSSYGMIIIRANADPPMDENNPDQVYSLVSYLNREQYGQQPLFYGPYYDAQRDRKKGGVKKVGDVYVRGYQVMQKRNSKPLETFTIKRDALAFMANHPESSSLYIRHRYVDVDDKIEPAYEDDRMTLFPRMWSPEHRSEYESWGQIGRGKADMSHNLRFFWTYQVGWMYWRYFMWNFAGRENDLQGHGEPLKGNWISGISFFDEMHLGYPQSKLPDELKNNKGRNKYYLLPFLIGMLGFVYHFMKDRRSWFVTLMLFIFTGIAIVIFLNQNPIQPRERDYAYAGSFYAFCIWIGFGVLAIAEMFRAAMNLKVAALAATGITLVAVPLNMLRSNWDDHNRSGRYTAPAFAYNYLNSCAPNAILFTNGDNDTFPLWYLQEVEGVRTDVRVVNLSLLNTDWYVTQMKRAAYDGAPVPFSFTEPEYRQGTRDQVLLDPYQQGAGPVNIKEQMAFIKNPRNVVPVGDNQTLPYFKSKQFIIPVDSAKIVSQNLVPDDMKARVKGDLLWDINKTYLIKSELMIVDLISAFDWERPVYFAITVGDRNYLGLHDYFIQEGLAYRLMPFKTNTQRDSRGNILPEVNTDKMFDLMTKEFKYGNINDPKLYLDETNMRMAWNMRSNFLHLATDLYEKGDSARAIQTLDKAEEILPDVAVPYNPYNYYMGQLYLALGEIKKGRDMIETVRDRAGQEVDYFKQYKSKEQRKLVERQLAESEGLYNACERILQNLSIDLGPDAGSEPVIQ